MPKSSTTIRVLIVDDDPLILVSLRRGLSRQADCEVIGEAANGEDAVRLTQELGPDIVVMDVHMPKVSGLEATAKLRSLGINTPVLFLTADPGAQKRAKRLANVRLLLKADAGISDTVKAVREVAGANRVSRS